MSNFSFVRSTEVDEFNSLKDWLINSVVDKFNLILTSVINF